MARSKTKVALKANASANSRTKRASSRGFSSRASSYLETLPSDWREFLRLVTEHRVKFVLVGGHAVALHGVPRATFDLDLLVSATSKNLVRLGAALRSFGFPGYAAAAHYLATPKRFMMMGRKPLRIDILNSIDGVSFDTVWQSRITARTTGLTLHFIGLRALLRNKRAAGRPKDLLDVAMLTERGFVRRRR